METERSGEKEPTTNYIKNVAFETVRKYFTYFSFSYFKSDNFIFEIEWETC